MSAGAPPPPGDRPEFVWDADRLRLTWANRDGLAFWGEDSLTDLVERIFAPDDETARALSARLAEIREGGEGRGRLTLNPRGEPVWAMADCAEAALADGRTGLRAALSEIETPGDALLARMRAGFDVAPRPIAIFDAAAAALARNEADRRAFPEARTLTRRYVDPAVAEGAIATALGDGAYSHTVTLNTRTGPRRHRVSLRRMRDPVAGALCVIADFDDLSDRPAQAAGRQVSLDALAGLAHDFRAPLMAIQGFAEFIQMSGDALAPAKRDQYLADIRTACRRLTGLADRMVALGAAGARGAAGRVERIDLARLGAEAARLGALRAADQGVALSFESDRAEVEVTGDPEATARILDNLISNALAHGVGPGGAVAIRARAAAGDSPASIEVADDGRGLSEAALATALKPYGRPDGGAPGARPGGLGLATCQDLAAAMAARLVFETAPGRGFSARLVFAV